MSELTHISVALEGNLHDLAEITPSHKPEPEPVQRSSEADIEARDLFLTLTKLSEADPRQTDWIMAEGGAL